jgi:hypothetical protein
MADVTERTIDSQAIEDGFAGMEATTGGEVAVRSERGATVFQDSIQTAQAVAVCRDEAQVLRKLKVLAAAAGENWYYRFPVKDRGRQSWIEGPSIKLANDLSRIYGNCSIDVRALDIGDHWMYYARFTDLETGFNTMRAYQQDKGQQTIKTKDAERSMAIAFQIGQSKAIRNVIVNALGTFADFAMEEAKGKIVERVGQKIEEYRTRVIGRLDDMNIDVERVEAAVGRTAETWLAHDIAKIIAELQSIKDGMSTANELYPGTATERPRRQVEDDKPIDDKPSEADTEAPVDADASSKDGADESSEAEANYEVVTNHGEIMGFDDAADAVVAFNKLINGRISIVTAIGLWESNLGLRRSLAGNPDLTDELYSHYQRVMSSPPPEAE